MMTIVLEKLKQIWQNSNALLKIVGVIIVVLIVLSLVSNLFGFTLRNFGLSNGLTMISPSATREMFYGEDSMDEGGMMKMGVANQAMPSPMPPSDGNFSGGNNAEDFEITEYNASIRTNDKEPVCSSIEQLKAKDYVVFENTNTYKTGCHYTFKVENEHAQEIYDIIDAFDPDNFAENTYTIKRRVDYITSEREILEEKLSSINTTLEESLNAYDEITRIATSTRDAESLATIIDSKVRLIEKLTQQRISINEQINRLDRNMSQQLERLDYTYFSVSVREDKYVDLENIKDSWKNAVQTFVHDTNSIIQGVTVGIIGLVLVVIQYVLYFFIVLFAAKFCWKHAKSLWMK